MEPDAFIVNEKGERVAPSRESLLLEGALQNERGQIVYAFLYADALVVTQMVNNGERFVLKSIVRLDDQSDVQSKGDRQFLVVGKRGKQKILSAKQRDVAATWVSNIEAVTRTMKGVF